MSKQKTKKLDLMSEEERLLYMRQKMLDEEEIQRRKEEMLSQFLKDKLSKEQHNTRINILKLTEKWRTVMREAKAADLRKDIEILSHVFERIVDRKDGIIRALTKDLEEAEQQYMRAMRNHVQNVDKLMDLQRSRLVVLEDEFEAELVLLKEELDVERQQMMAQHEREKTKLEHLICAIDQIFTEISNNAWQEFTNTKEDLIHKGLEQKHSLRVHLEGLVEELRVEFHLGLTNYVNATEDRKIAFETLKARDEKSSEETEIQMKEAQKIQDTISALKIKMAINTWKYERGNRKLREGTAALKQHFVIQKSQMNSLQAYEHKRLVKLTAESTAAIKALKNICAKVMTDFEALEQFWKRYNKVLFDQVVLQKEKQTLLQENQKLRQLLKQYLDGISVSDQILSNLNPLIVINNKTNVKINMPVTKSAKPVYNVIEAAHTMGD
ncbi:dynein regulatory complex subunit 2 isoform X2 [Mobula birostris]|uniref:dynein regulatory complex subunit 2 isoform X2 n=1 Tax=Mobula birostris TaxID=1983395 RepID=UPI003B28D598